MRGQCITAEEVAALQAMGQAVPDGLIQIDTTSQVFPVFVTKFMPKLFGGVVLGTLFITVVGGGSGLALGMASILVTDIFVRKDPHMKESKTNLLVTRGTIMVILVAAVIVAVLVPGAMINDFGFLSMGLQGRWSSCLCAGAVAQGEDPRAVCPGLHCGRAHRRAGGQLYESALRLPLPGNGRLPGDYGGGPGSREASK